MVEIIDVRVIISMMVLSKTNAIVEFDRTR